MPTEEERRELIAAFQRALGSEAAAIVMESLPPVPWNELATKADLEEFRLATRADLEQLRIAVKEDLERFASKKDLERFATKEDLERFATKGEILDLRGEFAMLRGDFYDLKGGFADLRVEMAELKIEVHSITPKLVLASLGTSATFMGFVLGAAALIR